MDARGVYNLAEIWPGFHMGNNTINSDIEHNNNNNAGATSYGVGLDHMLLTDQRSNHNPQQNSRKRSGENECARASACTSNSNGSSSNNNCNNNLGDNKRLKAVTSSENLVNKECEENSNKNEEQAKKATEPPKQDYIHVRARRGQATDSHSLAERARREKISERMKILQDLVPGCNKVIGKALVLDEIINYIQSLQRQVEFLSMKLEAVNTRMGIDAYPHPKDFVAQQSFDASNMAFASQSTREYGRDSSPEWLHMQIGGGLERTS